MQLSILADKLPHMSIEQFIHEFHVVHATETTKMARSLGIISQYIQGLALLSAGQEDIRKLPIPGPQESYQSFAQLTWAALEVMQGSFTTQGYKDSAGKHIFAQVRKIFLTDRLEPEVEHSKKQDLVKLVFVLVPSHGSSANFRESWDKHALFCRTICPHFQRNQVISHDPEKIAQIFAGTQFPTDTVAQYGGFEEFTFESNADAQAFCERHGEELASSYREFTANESFCLGFQVIIQYDYSDRGYQQIVTGAIFGTLLRFKLFFGL